MKFQILIRIALLFFSVLCFAQPRGGDIILNITYQGKVIQFKNSRKVCNTKLFSFDKAFELIDVSSPDSKSNSCLNYFPYMESVTKSMLWNANYHLKIVHKQRDTMNVYIENIMEGDYYLKIPFQPNSYKLLYVANPDEKINGKSVFLSAEEKYPLIWAARNQISVDITPIDWNAHRIDDISSLMKDYVIRNETYEKNINSDGFYKNTMPNCNSYKLKIEGDKVVMTLNTVLYPDEVSEHFYFQDCENHYDNSGYAEFRGELIKTKKDSTYRVLINNNVNISCHYQDHLVEGQEDKMMLDSNAGTIRVNKEGEQFLERLICKSYTLEDDKLIRPNDTLSIKDLHRYEEKYPIQYNLPMCNFEESYNHQLEFNYKSPFTNKPIVLPFQYSHIYICLKNYDSSYDEIEITLTNDKRVLLFRNQKLVKQ